MDKTTMLDVFRTGSDPSRRTIRYTLTGISFRDFLEYEYGVLPDPLPDACAAADDIEYGSDVKIPPWMFGLLY